ncbi:hypothetical protein D3C73_1494830 [compost metagenome]
MKGKAQHHRRKAGQYDMKQIQLRLSALNRFAGLNCLQPQQAQYAPPVNDRHGQNGTQLNDYFEGIGFISRESEKLSG